MKRFPAVSILASGQCCQAAKLLARHPPAGRRGAESSVARMLDAEPVPVSLPEARDRRASDDDRRLPSTMVRSAWYGGDERRKSRGRREDD